MNFFSLTSAFLFQFLIASCRQLNVTFNTDTSYVSSCNGNLSEAEYFALQAFYQSTGGPRWRTNANQTKWEFPSNLGAPCQNRWQGIVCEEIYPGLNSEGITCSVISLILPYTELQGYLPTELAYLPSLEIFYVDANLLTGSIPSQLGYLSSLTQLSLGENSLRGSIPSELGELSSLTQLYLYNNCLTGSIPSQLGDLVLLEILELDYNTLTGPIPSQFGQLLVLTKAFLFNNSLTGSLPSELGYMSSLKQLGLNDNDLTGSIPSQLIHLSSINEIWIYNNSLTGRIPFQLGNLSSMTILCLNGNFLTGSIPPELGYLSSLTQLELDANCLTGSIPSLLADLSLLTILYLNNNFLTSSTPPQLSDLSSLTQLILGANYLTGSIPSQLSDLSLLTQLHMYKNHFTSSIPSVFGFLSLLTQLDLGGNALTGSIPSQLGYLSLLTILWLNSNHLDGSIPFNLVGMSVLNELWLHDNALTGSLPRGFLEFSPNLTSIDLSNNKLTETISLSGIELVNCYYFNISMNSFSGSIPHSIGRIGSAFGSNRSRLASPAPSGAIGVIVDLSQNSFTGTIPRELFSIQMQTISLFSNCFTGSLPSNICSAVNLNTLVMDTLTSGGNCRQARILGFNATVAKNLMVGTIPSCVWTLSQLQTLHLSGNGLQGPLGDISATSVIVDVDVLNNYLTGSIPLSIQSYRGLRQLAVANNKLSGTLSESFCVSINMTLLTLSVNRLSGKLPQSIITAPTSVGTIDVLAGNHFSCDTALPISDNSSSNYICGSSTLNSSLYIFGTVFALQLFAILISRYSGKEYNHFLTECVDLFSIWWKRFLDSEFRGFLDITDQCHFVILCVGTFYILICMPTYVILKSASKSGTLEHQYTWVTTTAFLHGTSPVVLIFIFVAVSVTGMVLIMDVLQRFSTSSNCESTRLIRRIEWSAALQRVSFQLVSIIVLFVVNVAYVYALVSRTLSTALIVVLQIAVGIFKLLWKFVYISRIALSQIRKHEDISGSVLLFHEVAMNVFNFILAPCLATLGTDSNCLYDAIRGQAVITSHFLVTEFNTETVIFKTEETVTYPTPYEQEIFIKVSPPWLYSYQCTSALLTNYVPVLIFTYIVSGFFVPAGMCGLLMLSSKRIIGDTSFFPVRFLLLYVKKMVDIKSIITSLLVDLTILLTFGLASPLLALVIIFKQFNNAICLRLWIGWYLLKVENMSDEDVTQLNASQTQSLEGVTQLSFSQSQEGVTQLNASQTQSLEGVTQLSFSQSQEGVTQLNASQTQSVEDVTQLNASQSQEDATHLSTNQSQAQEGVTQLSSSQLELPEGVTQLSAFQSQEDVTQESASQSQSQEGVTQLSSSQPQEDVTQLSASQSRGGVTQLSAAQSQSQKVVTQLSVSQSQDDVTQLSASQSQSQDGVTQLNASQEIDGDLTIVSALLALVVTLFWGAMIFDMVADIYGSVTGAIVVAVSVAVWFTLVYCTHIILTKRVTWILNSFAATAWVSSPPSPSLASSPPSPFLTSSPPSPSLASSQDEFILPDVVVCGTVTNPFQFKGTYPDNFELTIHDIGDNSRSI